MKVEALVEQIRNGDAEDAIAEFLAVNTNISLENLVVSCLQWPAMEDVQEALLLAFLKENPDNPSANWAVAQILYGQQRFEEALPHYRKLLAAKEQLTRSYHGVSFGLSVIGAADELRALILEAKREIPEGEHTNWQFPVRLQSLKPPHRTHLQLWIREHLTKIKADRLSRISAPHVVTWHPVETGSAPDKPGFRLAGAAHGINATSGFFRIDGATDIPAEEIASAGSEVSLWQASFITLPGTTHDVILCLETADGIVEGEPITFAAGALPFAMAQTGNGYEIGTAAATFTGSVAAAGTDASYRFEYGVTPDDLSQSTPWKPVPGPLNGRFQAAPRQTPHRFYFYGSHYTLIDSDPPNVECHWPFGQDPNHISGVGFLELLFAAFPNSCQFDGYQAIKEWEGADLRDARFTIRLATRDFNPKDTQPCIGISSRRACWMLSGQTLDLGRNGGSDEIEVTVNLTADRGEWTFAGNNPIEQSNAERYGYEPLGDTLGKYIGNFFMVAPFGDPRDVITGQLTPKEVTLEYRSKSVLTLGSGCRLVDYPATSTADPQALTDGVRNDEVPGWYQSGPVGDTPPTFVWELANTVEITSIVVHQDPYLPTKRFRVTISGPKVSDIVIEEQMITDIAPLNSGRQLQIGLQDAKGYDRVKLELLEGASTDGLGLKAIEAFAKDFVLPASSEPVGVLEDVAPLTKGSSVFYRVVCRAGDIQATGDVHKVALPEDETPVLHGASVHATTPGKAVIRIQINPMGHNTKAAWRLDDGTTGEIPCGWENVAAHRFISVHDVPAGDRSLTIALASEAGTSPDLTVNWTQES